MKVVINSEFGGFSVSEKVINELGLEKEPYSRFLIDKNIYYLSNEDFSIESENEYEYRANPKLIEAIEKIGIKFSNSNISDLKIVDVPDFVVEKGWHISEYDGLETVHENHWKIC